jgi:putative ABC transport system substrate-binding protein
MRRRQFIAGLGSAAVWPVVARAQQSAPVIGFLNSASPGGYATNVAAFRQGLSEAGFIEGRNVAIEFRWAEDQIARLVELAADLVRRRVAVIVTENATTPAVRAATSTIPIVFVSGADPVQAGHVTSLNRPGGNVTGVTFAADPLNAKRLELLHELVPKPALIAVLMYTNSPTLERGLQDTELAARALGRQILIVKAGTESEIDAAFATIVQAGAGALFVGPGAFYYAHRRQLAALAARHALPTSFSLYEYVTAGGLMSYGTSITDAYRRGGLYVGRILKGEKPGEMPIEFPTRYKLVLNLGTAKALRLEIPAKLLALTDEVIQ